MLWGYTAFYTHDSKATRGQVYRGYCANTIENARLEYTAIIDWQS